MLWSEKQLWCTMFFPERHMQPAKSTTQLLPIQTSILYLHFQTIFLLVFCTGKICANQFALLIHAGSVSHWQLLATTYRTQLLWCFFEAPEMQPCHLDFLFYQKHPQTTKGAKGVPCTIDDSLRKCRKKAERLLSTNYSCWLCTKKVYFLSRYLCAPFMATITLQCRCS